MTAISLDLSKKPELIWLSRLVADIQVVAQERDLLLVGVTERHLELFADGGREPSTGIAREDATGIQFSDSSLQWGRRPGGPGVPPGPRNGWGGRIRTSGCEIQSLVPYRLATPHQQNGISVTVRSARGPPGVLAIGPKKLLDGLKRGAA